MASARIRRPSNNKQYKNSVYQQCLWAGYDLALTSSQLSPHYSCSIGPNIWPPSRITMAAKEEHDPVFILSFAHSERGELPSGSAGTLLSRARDQMS